MSQGVDDLVYLEEINDKSTTTLLESRYKENNSKFDRLIAYRLSHSYFFYSSSLHQGCG
jgi:hypothetical protein